MIGAGAAASEVLRSGHHLLNGPSSGVARAPRSCRSPSIPSRRSEPRSSAASSSASSVGPPLPVRAHRRRRPVPRRPTTLRRRRPRRPPPPVRSRADRHLTTPYRSLRPQPNASRELKASLSAGGGRRLRVSRPGAGERWVPGRQSRPYALNGDAGSRKGGRRCADWPHAGSLRWTSACQNRVARRRVGGHVRVRDGAPR